MASQKKRYVEGTGFNIGLSHRFRRSYSFRRPPSKKVRAHTPGRFDVEPLRRASTCCCSAPAHRGQVRHSGEPYLIHPWPSPISSPTSSSTPSPIAAGLLHDVVEDTLTTIERIQELFGPEVAHVVEGVTKISAIPFSSSEERQAENFRKMLLAMVDDIRVILVKLADRLHNMRTLSHLPEERRGQVAQETRDIYAPIANRLGMSKVKNELEELSFRYLEPQAYEALRTKVDAKRRATEGLIEELKSDDRRQARARRRCRSLEIDGRIKRLVEHPAEAEAAEDRARAGLRLHRAPDHHRQRQGLLRRARHHPPDVVAGAGPDQGLHRDAAAQRLPVAPHVGHQRARHAVRGADPHRWRCTGWRRKASPRTGSTRKAASAISATSATSSGCASCSSMQQEVRDPQEFIQNLKVELYPEEVYTFTPKGLVKALPRGATPIDFAYSIHTDVGHQCVGARQRQDGAAAHAPQERRHRRDRHRRPGTSRAATG